MANAENPVKEMAWLPEGLSSNGSKVLHIRHQGRWVRYTHPDLAKYRQADLKVTGIPTSSGLRTMQQLLKAGFVLITSEDAMKTYIRNLDVPQVESEEASEDCPEINEWG